MKVEVNTRGNFLLYLIALAATFLDWFVGAVAFICMTILIVAFLIVAAWPSKNEKKEDGKKEL